MGKRLTESLITLGVSGHDEVPPLTIRRVWTEVECDHKEDDDSPAWVTRVEHESGNYWRTIQDPVHWHDVLCRRCGDKERDVRAAKVP